MRQPYMSERQQAIEEDLSFIAAMIKAVRAGRERPPGIGIDTRPSTNNPRLITAQPPPINCNNNTQIE
jgi:hypothetical protein